MTDQVIIQHFIGRAPQVTKKSFSSVADGSSIYIYFRLKELVSNYFLDAWRDSDYYCVFVGEGNVETVKYEQS